VWCWRQIMLKHFFDNKENKRFNTARARNHSQTIVPLSRAYTQNLWSRNSQGREKLILIGKAPKAHKTQRQITNALVRPNKKQNSSIVPYIWPQIDKPGEQWSTTESTMYDDHDPQE
jgi:hypothetical protein